MGCSSCQKPGKENLSVSLAAMCHTCPKAERRGGEAVRCTINGQALYPLLVEGESFCPKGRHPDPAGLVRWAGFGWHGVPYPLRLWLWGVTALDYFRGRRIAPPRKPGEYQGCGCLAKAKAAVQKISALLTRGKRTNA